MVRISRLTSSILFPVLLSIALNISISSAGNKEMVEKNIQELDRLNKKTVSQLPELPRDGEVEIEADIQYEKGEPFISVLHKKIDTHYSENSTRQQDNLKTRTRKEPDLIKEGENYEVEQ